MSCYFIHVYRNFCSRLRYVSNFLTQTSIFTCLFDPDFDIYRTFCPGFGYLPDFLSQMSVRTGLFIPDFDICRTYYPGLCYVPNFLSRASIPILQYSRSEADSVKNSYRFTNQSRRRAAPSAAFHGVASTAHSAYQSSYKQAIRQIFSKNLRFLLLP